MLHDETRRKKVKKKKWNTQVYEPEPGRETPEEKRLREVDFKYAGIIIFFVNLRYHSRQTSNHKIAIYFFGKAMEKEARERLFREIEEARKRVSLA